MECIIEFPDITIEIAHAFLNYFRYSDLSTDVQFGYTYSLFHFTKEGKAG